MDVLLLHNPSAGGQEPSRGRLVALLRREGFEPRYFDLHAALKDPTTLPGAEFAVVAGGDGSFRAAALKLAGRGLPLAILPLGTANNVARTVGITGSIPEIIAGWDPRRRTQFDIGVTRGPWGEERFVEGVGIGLFARIIEILSHVKEAEAHAEAGPPHRVASDLRSTTVLAHEMAPVLVEAKLDGEPLSGQFLLLEIMNSGHVGAGIELAAADVSDGRFEVVLAQLPDREKLLESLRNVAMAKPSPSLLVTRRCQTVELILPPCEFRLDDRVIVLADPARVQISMSPESIEILAP